MASKGNAVTPRVVGNTIVIESAIIEQLAIAISIAIAIVISNTR